MISELAELAKSGTFDYIVIEPTGVSEPHKVAEAFVEFVSEFVDVPEEDNLLSKMIRIDCCVTVVDCSSFMDYFETLDLASDRFEDTGYDDDRLIIQLLVDQVEFANVILLNKTDLCSKEQLASVKRAIKKLNKTAKLIETVNSVVNLTEVINTGIFDHKNLELDARGWRKEEEDPEERGPEDVITSFVYKRDRPFHPDRLHELMSTAFMIDI